MTVVTDATVLIYLAKLGRLDLLDALFDRVLVPEAVCEEAVVQGREQGYADALTIHDATEDFLSCNRCPTTQPTGRRTFETP